MSSLNISTEMLFNNPQLLTQYLEEILVEVQTPYLDRKHVPSNFELNSKKF